MIFIAGVPVQDAILRDQAVSTLSEEDLMPEFDRSIDFAALDQIGVGFEDRIDFLSGGNLLSLEDTSASLIDNLICQPADPADLLAQRLDDQDESQIFSAGTRRGVDREPCIVPHLFSDGQQLAVGGDLLTLPLGRSHALELLHSTAGAASAVGKSRPVLARGLAHAS